MATDEELMEEFLKDIKFQDKAVKEKAALLVDEGYNTKTIMTLTEKQIEKYFPKAGHAATIRAHIADQNKGGVTINNSGADANMIGSNSGVLNMNRGK
jgi:hypothetical protein